MKLPLSRIEEFLSATGECELKEIAQGYSIDSRTIQPGELFFAVKGERLDGHDYVHQALEGGAVSADDGVDAIWSAPIASIPTSESVTDDEPATAATEPPAPPAGPVSSDTDDDWDWSNE